MPASCRTALRSASVTWPTVAFGSNCSFATSASWESSSWLRLARRLNAGSTERKAARKPILGSL